MGAPHGWGESLGRVANLSNLSAGGPREAMLVTFSTPEITHAEREQMCVSVQEHVWGTDGLAKLEAIKAKVDPQGLFQCQKCVGFKGPVRDQ